LRRHAYTECWAKLATLVFTDHLSCAGLGIFVRSYCAIDCQLNTVLQQTWRHCSESHDEWRHLPCHVMLSFLAAGACTQNA